MSSGTNAPWCHASCVAASWTPWVCHWVLDCRFMAGLWQKVNQFCSVSSQTCFGLWQIGAYISVVCGIIVIETNIGWNSARCFLIENIGGFCFTHNICYVFGKNCFFLGSCRKMMKLLQLGFLNHSITPLTKTGKHFFQIRNKYYG